MERKAYNMIKKRFCTIIALLLAVLCLFALASCGEDSKDTSDDEPHTYKTERTAAPAEETDKPSDPTQSPTEEPAENNSPAKIQAVAEENGIYSVVVRLTDKAADKGVIDLVYHGVPGTPQENSVVNTFRIEYYKNESNLFEITTFYDGELYLKQHDKDNVTVVNEFGALLRAGDVIVTYTPDGGTAQEIYRATMAELLRLPK